MEGVLSYILFAPGGIEGIPGIFPGNTVVYLDEATREVLQQSPIGTPFAGRATAQPDQGEALVDNSAQAPAEAANGIGG